MLKNQSQLSLLPLPDLKQTLDKYLKTIEPFLSQQDFEQSQQLAEHFLLNEGPVLQQRLLERLQVSNAIAYDQPPMIYHKEDIHDDLDDPQYMQHLERSQDNTIAAVKPTKNSWLIDWWNQYSYLRYREPVVLNVSFFFVFRDDPFRRTSVERAAVLIHAAMQFHDQILTNTLEPDTLRGAPMCMQQYKYLFNCCRMPCKPADIVKVYSMEYKHVVVIRHQQFFVLDTTVVGEDGSERALSVSELEGQITTIYQMAAQNKNQAPNVSILTATDRDAWTNNYRLLRSHSTDNATTLEKIQSAVFVLCLDESKPVTREEISHACWHNYGRNRWFDKSLQVIVFDNGRSGFLGEHSMFDATTPSRFCDFICDAAKKPTENQPTVSTLPAPQSLIFTLPLELQNKLSSYEAELAKQVNAQDLQCLYFAKHGKNFIKSCGMSPDSYVQMAIQLAYFKLFGTWAATYESAGMKRYAWGRTETCRSVSTESATFVKLFEDRQGEVAAKAQSCRKAVEAHSKYMTECLQGKGIDRHLLGLRLSVLENEPIPPFFLDMAYNLSCHWTLSTSQIPSENFENYGWGEVVPDGFGVAYMVNEDHLIFNITGLVGDLVPNLDGGIEEYGSWFIRQHKHHRVKWMSASIEQALLEMHFIFSQASAAAAPKPIPLSMPVVTDGQPKPPVINEPLRKTVTPPRSISESVRSPDDSRSQLGFSLAYPTRTTTEDLYVQPLSGVVGEDVGFIEFPWGEKRRTNRGWSTGSDSRGAYSRGRKLIRMLRDWNPLRDAGGGSLQDLQSGQPKAADEPESSRRVSVGDPSQQGQV